MDRVRQKDGQTYSLTDRQDRRTDMLFKGKLCKLRNRQTCNTLMWRKLEEAGFEPTTLRRQAECSTTVLQLLAGPLYSLPQNFYIG